MDILDLVMRTYDAPRAVFIRVDDVYNLKVVLNGEDKGGVYVGRYSIEDEGFICEREATEYEIERYKYLIYDAIKDWIY